MSAREDTKALMQEGDVVAGVSFPLRSDKSGSRPKNEVPGASGTLRGPANWV
ncbi:MAG: hypothetical protein ACJA2W_000231 [Planctomycetota bacterium]|jgi:hypothetical protein